MPNASVVSAKSLMQEHTVYRLLKPPVISVLCETLSIHSCKFSSKSCKVGIIILILLMKKMKPNKIK